MYTDEQFEQLEQEERTLTEEAIILMLALLASTKVELETELRSLYQRYGKDGVISYAEMRKWVNGKDHRKRLTVLLLFLADRFSELRDDLTLKFDDFLSEVVKKESNFFDVNLNADDILTTPWGVDDETWLARLMDDVELWNVSVANDLKQSFIRRDNVEDVIERLNKRFTSMEYIIKRLAMTESTAVGSLARRQIFKELGIKKYRFYAREGERTCDQCGSLHGLTFPMTAYEVGVTASPIHAHCRCWEVPIMD